MTSQQKRKGKTKQEKRRAAQIKAAAERRTQREQEDGIRQKPRRQRYVAPSNRLLNEYLARETPEKVFLTLSSQASTGSPTAALVLGIMLREGIGVPADHAKAARWFQQAVDKDVDEAYGCLGALYCDGLGVAEDMAKAHALLAEGAKRGDPLSQCGLGMCYAYGKGCAREPARAAALFDQAQAAGVTHACLELAKLCLDGRGVERDAKRAVACLERACAFGHDESRVFLAKLLLEGEQVQADPLRAARLLDEAAARGESAAYEPLGEILTTHGMDDEPRDIALKALQHGIDEKTACAMTALGDALMRGVTIPRDYDRARTLLADAERRGDPDATANLALMAFYGAGEAKNERKAFDLLEKAASAGSVKACVMAFKIYTQGQGGVAPDPARAEAWRKRAEELGAGDVDWNRTGQHVASPPAASRAERQIPLSLKRGIEVLLGMVRKAKRT